MPEQTIASLKPSVSRDEAARALTGGATGWSRRVALGPLRSMADVYVPFRIYRVDVAAGRKRQIGVLGLDLVSGTLDLYRFDRVPDEDQVVHVRTRNHLVASLTDATAGAVLERKVQRMAFERAGFFAIRDLRVSVDPVAEIHVPYWVGFFGGGETARLVALDAVRRRIEGAKVRRLLYRWLTSA